MANIHFLSWGRICQFITADLLKIFDPQRLTLRLYFIVRVIYNNPVNPGKNGRNYLNNACFFIIGYCLDTALSKKIMVNLAL